MLPSLVAVARFGEQTSISGSVTSLDARGLTIRLEEPAPSARHCWVRFDLPRGSKSCLALGEVVEYRDALLRVRFKHLFPDDRRALRRALTSAAAPKSTRAPAQAQVA